jgi:ABC-2 type transport system ATP-binding protein
MSEVSRPCARQGQLPVIDSRTVDAYCAGASSQTMAKGKAWDYLARDSPSPFAGGARRCWKGSHPNGGVGSRCTLRRHCGSVSRLMAAGRIDISVLPMENTWGSTVLETAGLTKRFGDRAAVAGLDLRVPARCAFGLLGPNGAGKTTLIRMALGLTRPTSGTVRLLGLPMPGERGRALAGVGAIVEEPRFHLHLTGLENLMVAAAVRGASAPGRVTALLERVGLADRAVDRVGGYSLGMRQRLGIARCLLNDPRLLVLDEPMNGLDPAGILQMRHLIRSLVDEGRTVMISSHLLDEVEKTCDMVAIMDQGRLLAEGPVAQVARDGGGQVLIGCDDPDRAVMVLRQHAAIARAVLGEEGLLQVTPAAGVTVAEVNRSMVEAGIAVERLEPVRATLEERFLEITSRLEAGK